MINIWLRLLWEQYNKAIISVWRNLLTEQHKFFRQAATEMLKAVEQTNSTKWKERFRKVENMKPGQTVKFSHQTYVPFLQTA